MAKRRRHVHRGGIGPFDVIPALASRDPQLIEPDFAPQLVTQLALGRGGHRPARPPSGAAFFEAMSRDDDAALNGVARRRRYGSRGTLVHQGDLNAPVVVVVDGHVAVRRRTAGRDVLLHVAGRDDVILGASPGHPAPDDLVALDAVEALLVPPRAWERLAATSACIANAALAALHARLAASERRRVQAATLPTTARLAGVLLELAERYGTAAPDGIRIELPLSQNDLAGWIGASHKAVATALAALRAAGAVRTARRTITITRASVLRSIAAA